MSACIKLITEYYFLFFYFFLNYIPYILRINTICDQFVTRHGIVFFSLGWLAILQLPVSHWSKIPAFAGTFYILTNHLQPTPHPLCASVSHMTGIITNLPQRWQVLLLWFTLLHWKGIVFQQIVWEQLKIYKGEEEVTFNSHHTWNLSQTRDLKSRTLQLVEKKIFCGLGKILALKATSLGAGMVA